LENIDMDRKRRADVENDVEGFTANNRLNRIADYAVHGRCHKDLSDAELNGIWIAAFREMAAHPGDPERWHAVNDLDAEFELRGHTPPYLCVREYQDQYSAAIFGAFAKMTDEEQAAVNRQIQRDIDDFKSRRDSSKN